MTSKLATSQEEHIRPSAIWSSEGAPEYNVDDMAREDEEFNEEQKDEYIEYEMQERTDAMQHPNQDDMARADEEFNEEQKEEYVEYEMKGKTDDVQHQQPLPEYDEMLLDSPVKGPVSEKVTSDQTTTNTKKHESNMDPQI